MAAEEVNNTEDQDLFGGFDFTAMENMAAIIDNSDETKEETGDDVQGSQAQEEFNQEQTDEVDNEESTESTEENEDPSSQDTSDENSSSQLYTAIAKSLAEEGLLQFSEDSKIESAEDLLGIFRTNFEASINQYKESFDPRVKWLNDNLEQGVPFEKILQMDKDNITYNSIEEDSLSGDIELQKTILKDYYKRTTRFSDERINKEINRLDDLGELDIEAKSSLTDLKVLLKDEEQAALEKAQQEAIAVQQAQEKALEDFKKTLESTQELIPGLPLTNTVRDKVYKTMTTPVGQDAYGNPMNSIGKLRADNPLDFEMKLALVFEYTKGLTDFSIFNASGKKSAIKDLENAASKMDLQKSTNTFSGRMPKLNNDLTNAMRKFSQNNF